MQNTIEQKAAPINQMNSVYLRLKRVQLILPFIFVNITWANLLQFHFSAVFLAYFLLPYSQYIKLQWDDSKEETDKNLGSDEELSLKAIISECKKSAKLHLLLLSLALLLQMLSFHFTQVQVHYALFYFISYCLSVYSVRSVVKGLSSINSESIKSSRLIRWMTFVPFVNLGVLFCGLRR